MKATKRMSIEVTLTLPDAMQDAYLAKQQIRERYHLSWQTLPEYLADLVINASSVEHQRELPVSHFDKGEH
jgi:hypothetical protein